MALVVEDGTGLSNAEAYISVADATTYHAAYGNPSSWTAASTAAQENALRVGAQYLDARYGQIWRGDRANETQALDWPRSGAVDDDGYAFDSDDLPTELERANAIAALKVIDGDTLFPDLTDAGAIQSKSITAGLVSKSVTYVGSKPLYKTYTLIDNLLAPLLEWSSAVDLA